MGWPFTAIASGEVIGAILPAWERAALFLCRMGATKRSNRRKTQSRRKINLNVVISKAAAVAHVLGRLHYYAAI